VVDSMQYRFATPEWFAALHGVLVQRAGVQPDSSDSRRMSICEVYVAAPEGMAEPSRRLAWSCVIDGSIVEFRLEERDDVDLKIEVDYATAASAASLVIAGTPEMSAAYLALHARALAEGKLRITGIAPRQEDGEAGSIHDVMAQLSL
jgi:hypothetical protein